MSKCKKARNPCKICLQSVTPKSGIQCQGACEAWAHFACLNYTPGRVNDILKNQITVTCPCPDCKTSVPKEFQTNTPYTCNNIACPANHPPACDGADCQANAASKGKPIPVAPPGTLTQCGAECQEYSGCRKYVASTVSANRMKEEKEKQMIEKTRLRQERIRMESMAKGMSATGGRTFGGHLTPGGTHVTSGGGPMSNYPEDCPPTEEECGVQELIGTIGQLSEQIYELMKHLKCASNKESCKNLSDKCAELSVALCCASRMYARGSSPNLGRSGDRRNIYTARTSSSHGSCATGREWFQQAQFQQPQFQQPQFQQPQFQQPQFQQPQNQRDSFGCCCSNQSNYTVSETRSCFCTNNPAHQ